MVLTCANLSSLTFEPLDVVAVAVVVVAVVDVVVDDGAAVVALVDADGVDVVEVIEVVDVDVDASGDCGVRCFAAPSTRERVPLRETERDDDDDWSMSVNWSFGRSLRVNGLRMNAFVC
jgi:hypothetical protein